MPHALFGRLIKLISLISVLLIVTEADGISRYIERLRLLLLPMEPLLLLLLGLLVVVQCLSYILLLL